MGHSEERRAQLMTVSYVVVMMFSVEAVLDQAHSSAPLRHA